MRPFFFHVDKLCQGFMKQGIFCIKVIINNSCLVVLVVLVVEVGHRCKSTMVFGDAVSVHAGGASWPSKKGGALAV